MSTCVLCVRECVTAVGAHTTLMPPRKSGSLWTAPARCGSGEVPRCKWSSTSSAVSYLVVTTAEGLGTAGDS